MPNGNINPMPFLDEEEFRRRLLQAQARQDVRDPFLPPLPQESLTSAGAQLLPQQPQALPALPAVEPTRQGIQLGAPVEFPELPAGEFREVGSAVIRGRQPGDIPSAQRFYDAGALIFDRETGQISQKIDPTFQELETSEDPLERFLARQYRELPAGRGADRARARIARELGGIFQQKQVVGLEQKEIERKERKDQADLKLEQSKIQKELEESKKPDFKKEQDLRKEFTQNSKDFIIVQNSKTRIDSLRGAEQNAATDLSLIFAYMKLLDPPSVVREGEQATAREARGVPETIRNLYNRILEGERLVPEQRERFYEAADTLFEGQRRLQDQRITFYNNIAQSFNLDPTRITGGVATDVESFIQQGEEARTQLDFNSVQEAEAANLPIGTEIIINGRRAVIE